MSRYRLTITVDIPHEVFHKHLSAAGSAIAKASDAAPAGADNLLLLLGLSVMPPDYRASWWYSQIPDDLLPFVPVGECVVVEEVEDAD